jgi:hypothetical protein
MIKKPVIIAGATGFESSKKYTAMRIVLVVMLLLATVTILGLVLFLNGAFQDKGPESANAAIQAQLAERKDFKAGETAKIGPLTLDVTNIERNYLTTGQDIPLGSVAPLGQAPADNKAGYTEVFIPEEKSEYVLVEGEVELNGSKAMTRFDDELLSMRLNGVTPYAYKVTPDEFSRTKAQEGQTYTFRYVYRIAKDSDTLRLEYSTTIFTKLSPIFGSEGAPSQYLKYSILLN